MSYTVPAVAAGIVVVLAGVVYTTQKQSNSSVADSAEPVVSTEADVSNTDSAAVLTDAAETMNEDAAAFSVSVTEESDLVEDSIVGDVNSTPSSGTDAALLESDTTSSEAIDFARSLARDRMDDKSILDSARAMADDDVLLSAVLDEFSVETDTERLARLRLVLGQLSDESLVSVAESMAFSGNPESADAALDLLRDISPRVPAAKSVALDVMSSTQDAELLLGATSVISVSSPDDPEVAQRVVSSLSSIVQHPDARVRRLSYSSLAKWTQDASSTPVLLQGLNDEDSSVRKSTAYGLVGYPHVDASVVEALLQTAENQSEIRRARRGAVLALTHMTLDDSQTARFQAAQAQVN